MPKIDHHESALFAGRIQHLTRKRMEPAGSSATWTGSPKGVFAPPKHHKPRHSLKNNTAGVHEPGPWIGRPSDIEGKTTRLGASKCGQRTSFNRTGQAEGRMSGSK